MSRTDFDLEVEVEDMHHNLHIAHSCHSPLVRVLDQLPSSLFELLRAPAYKRRSRHSCHKGSLMVVEGADKIRNQHTMPEGHSPHSYHTGVKPGVKVPRTKEGDSADGNALCSLLFRGEAGRTA